MSKTELISLASNLGVSTDGDVGEVIDRVTATLASFDSANSSDSAPIVPCRSPHG